MLWLFTLVACRGGGADPGPALDLTTIFPSAHMLDGDVVALPDAWLPMKEDGTPFPVDRVNGRTGFSAGQTALWDPGVALDPASLLGATDPDPADPVQVWDLDDGRQLRAFAELDASPYTEDDEVPVVLIRPMEPWPDGHRIAVAVVGVADEAGDLLPQAGWLAAVLDGRPGPGLEAWEEHYANLAYSLEDLGVADLQVVFDFPIGGGADLTDALLDEVPVPEAWAWSALRDADDGDALPPHTWRQAEGTFTAPSWLVDDDAFSVIDGAPELQGDAEVALYVHLPDSVRDAAPGTAPVWIFGHGIFSAPGDYLGEDDDPSAVLELADRAGAIVLATRWRGLYAGDLTVALAVGTDFGRFPELTDKLAQAMANHDALIKLALDGGLLDDPIFDGRADATRLSYYGISLGGIEGAALVAREPRLEHAVLHVAGGAWSMMLERSVVWTSLEALFVQQIPRARDRQLLLAASQLLWDPVDPVSITDRLRDRSVLWQESVGDEFVANRATELVARGVGASLLEPADAAVVGLSAAPAPLSGPALARFDPQAGSPPDENRPAPASGAHAAPRLWDGAIEQTRRFLDPDDPGVVEHACGDAVCSAENPG